MVRDKDLVKWGRGVGILMFFLAAFSFGSVFALNFLIDHKIEPALSRAIDLDQKQILFLESKGYEFNSEKQIGALTRVNNSVIRIVNAIKWILIALGLLAFSHGLVSWRSHDLAVQKQNKSAWVQD